MRSSSMTLLLLGALSWGAYAQRTQTSDPLAVKLAEHSVAAVIGKSRITDVTLTGSATLSKQEVGDFRLLASGPGESRFEFVSSSGTTTVVRDAQTGVSVGDWNAPGNRNGRFALHNCLTDSAWFFPALGSLAPAPTVTLTYIGKELRNGTEVQHLHSSPRPATSAHITSAEILGDMDFYLDATTLLPIASTFNTHPDDDASTNLLVEIDFSQYQQIDGVLVPMHIQRYQQGYLMLELFVTGTSFNSGLPLKMFAIK